MNRFAAFAVSLSAAALLSACVFAPPSHSSNVHYLPNAYDASALEKNSERALTACGAGNVKEVNAKGFSCK